ncbi:carboxylesterase/lipase family protein [Lichenicola sp.]|uniref:carboxylesterase/lipase family protein n=1 Tax=Lichenicola sp. TaxID=2804529 RepID=UPI003AFFE359
MSGHSLPDLQVRTEAGVVEGHLARTAMGPVGVWRGIRYAEAPRFEAPRPPAQWTGIQGARAFGPACPQMVPGLSRPFGASGDHPDEACLVLNIFSAGTDAPQRPVMVWIHGGAFVLGSADMYDATHFAASDEIVVVTINYRLGLLGFLDLGHALDEPRCPGNLGLRDQIAALRWVRDNIAGFGGDPDRVTIAGESAGSVSVSLLMLCPDALPLFHGAIMQSGALTITHEAARAEALAHRFLVLLGEPAPSLELLQALPVRRLLEVQRAVQQELTAEVAGLPWFDGSLLPASLADAERIATPPIPLLAGTNRDEYRSFEILPGGVRQRQRDKLEQMLRRRLGEGEVDAILEAYPMTRQGSLQLATDIYFGMPTLHFAERHATLHAGQAGTWFYRFDIAHPLLGAAHGLDLLYLFDMHGLLPAALRGGPLAGTRAALAGRMRSHWIAFVRDGQPNADWPPFEPSRRTTKLFDRVDRLADDPHALRRSVWPLTDQEAEPASIMS